MARIPSFLTMAAVIAAQSASAEVLLDTGSGTFRAGNALTEEQFLAVAVHPKIDQTISAIEGWIGVVTSGTITVALYTDDGGKPGDYVDSTTFLAEISQPAWLGVKDLNWELPAKKHYIAFEVHDSTFDGYLAGAAQPIPDEAYYIVDQNEWHTEGGGLLSLGVRVLGGAASADERHGDLVIYPYQALIHEVNPEIDDGSRRKE
jgi:hypothetical protein